MHILMLLLSYLAHAEKAMPEIGIDLMRSLSTKGAERVQLYCPMDPKSKCSISKLAKDIRVAQGEVSHRQATDWVQAFYLGLPKGDLKKRTRQESLPNGPEISNAWFVMLGDTIAFGQINKRELANLPPDQKKRADALSALEMKILSSLKNK